MHKASRDPHADLAQVLEARFGPGQGGDATAVGAAAAASLARLAGRRACRRYAAQPIGEGLMRLVLAAGFAAPSKSDLQQADVVWVRDPGLRAEVTRDCGDWVVDPDTGPAEVLVICGDGARFAALYDGGEFPNDHFDALFNATGDAAILLANLVAAAALAGLGSCPISVMRNRAAEVSEALGLPERVFPFAGLALGWPLEPEAPISARLGPAGALHIDRFDAGGQPAAVAAYDARRAAAQTGSDGRPFVWSEAKRRQYARAQRAEFGAFLRARGFSME
ncbi:MAG: nitroreductase family protein [Pseudomonadota bacterium]